MIPPQDYPMYQAMKKYGGSFVSCLADLLQHADAFNYGRLEAVFSEYFKQYRKMAEDERVCSECGGYDMDHQSGCVKCE